MLKYALITGAVLIAAIALLFTFLSFSTKADEKKLLKFIKDNPNKSALTILYNGEKTIGYNENRMMPLASTVKIIIAIEYAYQVTEGKIDKEEKIQLDEIDQFYVANTDGGAHPGWLKTLGDKSADGSISIHEIAKGMILYSSNANTEWLSKRLGLENINARIPLLELTDHSPVYYIVSSLFIGKEKFPDLKGDSLISRLRALSDSEYENVTTDIHEKLLTDSKYRNDQGDLSLPVQRVWSDRLTRSTTKEYAHLMTKINSTTFFQPEVQEIMEDLMEWPMVYNPKNREIYDHLGMKGGSTAFVLTDAIYATDKKSNKIEMAIFLDDLGIFESMVMNKSLNSFVARTLNSQEFREEIQKELSTNK